MTYVSFLFSGCDSKLYSFPKELTEIIFSPFAGFYFRNMKKRDAANASLVNKYNLPVPRYTSYPTLPFWNETIDTDRWLKNVKTRFAESGENGISLYIHLPFCESLCTYCGCNKKITTNHTVEAEYIDVLEQEWLMYKKLADHPIVIRELHLGGGTPTFFSAENIERLLQIIFKGCKVHLQNEFSVEGHPNNTNPQQLSVLYRYGFRRISYGVQDNDSQVQQLINRVQPFENLEKAVRNARDAGFTSINFDLIYGLPCQTTSTITATINKVTELKPDRIAFYSYAHVPWTSRGQRLFDEHDLPAPEEKMKLYLLGKKLFENLGYSNVGMDHFALPGDELFKAGQQGRLHRNFMGYTTQKTAILLGLGVSAISDTGNAYAQNDKSIHNYYTAIRTSEPAVIKGYFLSNEDIDFKKYILDIACTGKTTFKAEHLSTIKRYALTDLEILENDELIEFGEAGLSVTPLGKHFTRNICKAFDMHLQRNRAGIAKSLFSNAV